VFIKLSRAVRTFISIGPKSFHAVCLLQFGVDAVTYSFRNFMAYILYIYVCIYVELMDRDLLCPQPEYVDHTKSDNSVSKLT
jgi:hypothetical protein